MYPLRCLLLTGCVSVFLYICAVYRQFVLVSLKASRGLSSTSNFPAWTLKPGSLDFFFLPCIHRLLFSFNKNSNKYENLWFRTRLIWRRSGWNRNTTTQSPVLRRAPAGRCCGGCTAKRMWRWRTSELSTTPTLTSSWESKPHRSRDRKKKERKKGVWIHQHSVRQERVSI